MEWQPLLSFAGFEDSLENREEWEVHPQIWLWQLPATSLLDAAPEGQNEERVEK